MVNGNDENNIEENEADSENQDSNEESSTPDNSFCTDSDGGKGNLAAFFSGPAWRPAGLPGIPVCLFGPLPPEESPPVFFSSFGSLSLPWLTVYDGGPLAPSSWLWTWCNQAWYRQNVWMSQVTPCVTS